ncbi:Alpha/beta hydrolase fold-3 domain protein [Bradyrhizobium sp. STM 3843]|uniref:alpha/beta hydrolase n=1 Tax=Bradyrhizobium sp. STM 3843 TaxID=551947 RepID=UPI000240A4A5|nr:alpha/beta hydrolase [Bradyrhizobium sp. STM 3843]CCE04812.1 Alpha/beta hydrolase fold-3 domain protein [Bradyrhizobium sp. STM 3843]
MVHHDPDVEQLRRTAPAFLAGLRAKSYPEQRATFDAAMGGEPLLDGVELQGLDLSGVPAEKIIHRGAAADKALLFLHGGGYVVGGIKTNRSLLSRLAIAAGVTGYHIDYRLAPEHPYPAALEDALSAYRAILASGIKPENLIVGGESAGGNLATALLLKARDSGLPQPAGLYLLSPWLDMSTAGESYDQVGARDPIISRDAMRVYAANFLGDRRDDAYTSPVRADLSGLPLIMIQVGTEEVLLSDSLAFVNRAALAGQGVRLDVWAGMTHSWPFFHAVVRAGITAIEEAAKWMRGRLGIGTTPNN